MNPSVIFTHTMMIIGRMPSSLSFIVSTNFNMLKRLLNIRVASQVEWSLVLLLFCSRPVDFCTFCVHCVCVPCADDVGMSREYVSFNSSNRDNRNYRTRYKADSRWDEIVRGWRGGKETEQATVPLCVHIVRQAQINGYIYTQVSKLPLCLLVGLLCRSRQWE